jgi:hypothetical protein
MTITPKGLAKIIMPFCRQNPKHPNWGKLDFIVVISGLAGIGKSTIMIQVGKAYTKSFSYEKNLVYSKQGLTDTISRLKGGLIDVDEAVNVVFKREFFNHDQIGILKDLDTYRSNHNCISFLIPNFWDLDSKLLNSGRIKIWIWVKRWGEAYIMRPTNKQFSKDPWNFDLNVKLEAKGMIHNSPNFLDKLIWKELPKDEYEIYDATRIRKREEARVERQAGVTVTAKQKKLMQSRHDLIKLAIDLGATTNKIAEVSGMSAPAISRIHHSKENSPPEI